MTSLGIVFRPQLPPELLRDVAVAADEAGVDELWLWEDCFLESGIASASAALAWTDRLHVGVGLLPAPLRNVALTAMEAATLHRLFPDRVTLAVGHGGPRLGARPEPPRQRLTLLEPCGNPVRLAPFDPPASLELTRAATDAGSTSSR